MVIRSPPKLVTACFKVSMTIIHPSPHHVITYWVLGNQLSFTVNMTGFAMFFSSSQCLFPVLTKKCPLWKIDLLNDHGGWGWLLPSVRGCTSSYCGVSLRQQSAEKPKRWKWLRGIEASLQL